MSNPVESSKSLSSLLLRWQECYRLFKDSNIFKIPLEQMDANLGPFGK